MLRKLGAKNNIDPTVWYKKEIIRNCIDRVGKRSFDMLKRILKTYVNNRDQDKSGGFFKLGMIIGYEAESPVKDVDRLWNRMLTIYGEDEYGVQATQKTLGTLLMIIIAEDDRHWVWEPDPEKFDKQQNGEKPDGNIYYKDPSSPKQHNIKDLTNKFKNK